MTSKLRSKSTRAPARRTGRRNYPKTATLSPVRLAPYLALDMLATPRLASLALLAVCLATLAFFSYDARFYVGQPVVRGNQYVDTGDVVRASELEDLHVAWVQPERAGQLITQRLPSVRAAQAACTLPASCTITVEERQPLFAWRQGDAWAWIDAEGVLFTAPGDVANALVVDMPAGKLTACPARGLIGSWCRA